MAGFEPYDPRNDFFEEVHLGRRFPLCCSNVILKYDSATGGFTAQSGRIIQKTPQRTQKNTPTTLTVKAKGGCEFHVTRNPRGEYRVDNCCTWITVEKMYKTKY